MAFVWVRSGSYSWNMCITVWGWQNQCVSQPCVWCYLKHLLLHPVSAWRLCCCSAPAGRFLWSSSIKTSSPAKFVTARGHEPTHISSNIMLKSDVNFRCPPTYVGREGRWCLIPDSSTCSSDRTPSQSDLCNNAPHVPCCFRMELWPRSG